MGQGRQARGQLDSPILPQLSQQRGSAPAPCAGLQSRQLHEDAGLAEGGGALVPDHAAREANQDRRKGRATWPLHHIPAGRGCYLPYPDRRYPAPDRPAAAGSITAMTGLDPKASTSPTGQVCAAQARVRPHGAKWPPGRVLADESARWSGRSQCAVPDQGRIRPRTPFVLRLSVAGKGHLGNLG